MAVPCHLDLFTRNFHFGLPDSIQYKPSQHFFQHFFYHFFSISSCPQNPKPGHPAEAQSFIQLTNNDETTVRGDP
jgi:hypothetical protein